MFRALRGSAYEEPTFRLSTEIAGVPAYTPYFTGDEILSCFGFDEERYVDDLGYMVAIGAAGLVLAFALLYARR